MEYKAPKTEITGSTTDTSQGHRYATCKSRSCPCKYLTWKVWDQQVMAGKRTRNPEY